MLPHYYLDEPTTTSTTNGGWAVCQNGAAASVCVRVRLCVCVYVLVGCHVNKAAKALYVRGLFIWLYVCACACASVYVCVCLCLSLLFYAKAAHRTLHQKWRRLSFTHLNLYVRTKVCYALGYDFFMSYYFDCYLLYVLTLKCFD